MLLWLSAVLTRQAELGNRHSLGTTQCHFLVMSSPNTYDLFLGGYFPQLSRGVLIFHSSKETNGISLPPNPKPHVPSLEGQVVSPKRKRSLFSCALHLYQCLLTEHLLPRPLEGTDGIMWCSLLLVTGFANELKLWFPNFWTNGPLSTLIISCRLSKHLAGNSPWVGFSAWWWF